jgi:hypothetical protein
MKREIEAPGAGLKADEQTIGKYTFTRPEIFSAKRE